MSLDIGAAIENGLERSLKRNSIILMGIFALVSLISTVFGDSMTKAIIESGALGGPVQPGALASATPLALDISPMLSGAMLLLVSLVSAAITVGAIRLFISEETESVPTEIFTDNILWVLANIIIGSIFFAIVLGIGFVAFLIPGVFLLSALYFWNFYIIDEGQNFFQAMKSSWRDTKDNRIRTLALLLIVLIATGTFSIITSLILGFLGGLVAGTAGGSVLSIIPSAIVTVFTLATFTEAYKQLSE